VRLAAIDASESHQPFKQRSKQELSGLCYLEQAQIWPRDIDRYGRTVADVRCRAEGAGRHQVAAGLAGSMSATRRGRSAGQVQYAARRSVWACGPRPTPWRLGSGERAQHCGWRASAIPTPTQTSRQEH
jgi:endonuclease YncB( thermonuclease family)